ncbi:MAG: nucleotide-binding protein [Flavobacteriales bacterium]|nr:nucleotide-binding protein [Flavobacteriales bacterium]
MANILPKYEVLYSDLRNHFIGNYLASRDFKIFMSEIQMYDDWKRVYEDVKKNRKYFAFGTDHEPGDAADTFALYINAIEDDPGYEKLISLIIANFISWVSSKHDFGDLIQSATVAQFSDESIERIREAINQHEAKEFVEVNINNDAELLPASNLNEGANIFIVHGHNEEIKQSVGRIISKLGLNPIILHEQSNSGMTVIEKLEKHSEVEFAIVLLTFDDYGNAKNEKNMMKRSRQNVILELGYFIAKLGRQRVLPLYEDGVELPTDMSGVLYTKIDSSENWKFRLVKELQSLGFDVDANKIL